MVSEMLYFESFALRSDFESGQRFVTGNDVEEFLVDRSLTQAAEGPIQASDQVVDVLLGPLHGRETAGVFGRQRFGARLEERDEEILPDECLQRRLGSPITSGRFLSARGDWPACLPIFRPAAATAGRRVRRTPGPGAVVEDVELRISRSRVVSLSIRICPTRRRIPLTESVR